VEQAAFIAERGGTKLLVAPGSKESNQPPPDVQP